MDRKAGHLTKDISNVVSSLLWIKLVGIGNPGSGKTSLIKYFCESKFISGYQPTVGVDYGFKIQSVNNIEVRVHLWDLSGSSEYLDVRNELYGTTDAVFLLFDVSNKSSFESLDTWLRELSSYTSSNPEIFLIGNKIDVAKNNRVISAVEAKRWAAQHRLKYYETSAASGEGIDKMITDLLAAVISKRKPIVTSKLSDCRTPVTIMPTAYRSKSAKR